MTGTSLIVVEPIDKDVAVILNETLSPAAQSQTLADFARQCLADALATNEAALGYLPPYLVYVDGVLARSEDQVSADGDITYEFQLISDVLIFIEQQLVAHSPVLTGRYQRSHVLYADGVETDPENPTQASEYVFLNTQPYARKIENGLSPAAPDGVYEGVALQAAIKYGNMATFEFTYRGLISGILYGKSGRRPRTTAKVGRTSSRSAAAQSRSDVRYPAIVIRALS